jgi:hypothetical protein
MGLILLTHKTNGNLAIYFREKVVRDNEFGAKAFC